MVLSEIEQAFAENLILLGALTGPQLIYPLISKERDQRPLWEIVDAFGLVPPELLQDALNTAQAALDAAGQQAFSFSEGAMVGTWELIEQRGKAPGGEMWLGRRDGETGTLRLVSPGSGQDLARAQRFIERSNAGLDPPHPAVLKIDEAEEDFGWLYTATIGMDCRSLSGLRAPGPLPEPTAAALAQSLAGSLAVVHDLGVVHGGLNPLAILVREQRIYVADFGVSAALYDGPSAGSRPGGRLGLLLYTSPGLIKGDAARGLDSRDDLYALGALVLHAVSAVGPGDQRAAHNAPWLVAPPVSEGLKTILGRLLSPQPQGCYPNARALLDDLARVSSGNPPGPLPQGESIRGRRTETCVAQEIVKAEVYQEFASPSESSQNLTAAPQFNDTGPISGVAPPMEDLSPEEGYEEDYEEDYEDEKPVKLVTAPRARSSRLELTSAPTRKKGGGWLLFLFTVVVMVGGAATAYGVLQPVGVDYARAKVDVGVKLLAVPEPQYAEVLAAIEEAIEAGAADPKVVREALVLLAEIDRRSRGERAKLVPDGIETEPAAIKGKRVALEALSQRAAGLGVETLIEFDLARADKEENQHVWGTLADALLAHGDVEESELAYRKNGSKKGQKRVEGIRKNMVYLRGGPYLVPDAEGALGIVRREPCYVSRTEVTRREYAEFLGVIAKIENPHKYCELGEPDGKAHAPDGWVVGANGTGDLPASGLDYYDASAYAKWREGQLPDPETLIVAARGPRCLAYPWGDGPPSLAVANVGALIGGPTPTGCFPGGAGPSGAVDLLGNVAEWTRVDVLGVGAPTFGGHHDTPGAELKSAIGEEVPLAERRATVGFRVMMTVLPGK